MQTGYVAGAVTDEGHGLFSYAGEHKLALLALGKHLAGVGVDDLGDKVVLVNVESAVALALKGDAGADHFTEAVDIPGLDLELVFNVPAHALGPGLCTEEAHLQLEAGGVNAHLGHGLGHDEGVRGSAADKGAAKVLKDLDLTLGVAGADRNGGAADGLCAAVGTKTAGEQTVAVGNVGDIVLGNAAGGKGSGHNVAPDLEVVTGVANDSLLTGGTGGCVDAYNVAQGCCKKSVGVIVTEILLAGKRKQMEIVHRFDVLGLYTHFDHLCSVGSHVVINALYGLPKALALKGLKLCTVHCFIFFLPHRNKFDLSLCMNKRIAVFSFCFCQAQRRSC